MKFRIMMSALLAVITGVLVSAFVASPAQASIADCGNYPGTICFADTRSWGGRIWRQYPSQIVGCRKFAPDSFNNLASIGVNNTDDSAPPVGIDLYDADNCTGTPVFVASGYSVNLWATTPNLENKASSIRVVYF